MQIWLLGQWITSYMGKKGQNLVEYAILLAIIVAIGYAIFSTNGLKENIQSIFVSADNFLYDVLKNSGLPATWWWYPRN